MKKKMFRWLASCALLLAGAAQAQGLSPDQVRSYDEVFVLSAQALSRDEIELRWEIADNYYLYNNRFLRIRSATEGVTLGTPELPAGKREFDELLNADVVKYHDEVRVRVPLTQLAENVESVTLQVRSQGCLESVLCYPPSMQTVAVSLPAAAATANAAPLDGLTELLGGGALAPASGAPALPAEQAFSAEALVTDASTVLMRFTPQPGYYLYLDKFEFVVVDASGVSVAAAELPEGTLKDDPEFGVVPVLFEQAEIPVRLRRAPGPATSITLEARFQGCRDGDICYPPQQERFELELEASATGAATLPVATTPPAVPVSEQGRLAALLIENPAGALLAFFIGGILLAFTPCVFPMVPILSGIIAGEGDRITTGRALTLSLVYVLAMALTYTAAGVLAGLFGQNLQAMFQNPWIISFFVLIFVLLALSMFGFYELQLPSRWQTSLTEQSNRQQGGRLGGVAVMGFLSALIVGPCVAPPLAAALIVIGETGSAGLGGAALFAMSLGMGVPLILFGLSAGKFLPRAGQWMNAVKAVFGVGLLGLGIWMLERIVPGPVIMVLWGLLAISCAVHLGALERIAAGASGWSRLWKALGVSLLIFGGMQLVGAASGGDYWLRPLAHFGGGGQSAGAAKASVAFARIKSLEDLDAAVARGHAAGQPAMLDFYADWCVECIRMERNTFPTDPVQAELARFTPLKADVTQNDEIDQALMGRYRIIGPPAILFFDREGKEMEAYRLVGYFGPEAFAAHLRAVREAW